MAMRRGSTEEPISYQRTTAVRTDGENAAPWLERTAKAKTVWKIFMVLVPNRDLVFVHRSFVSFSHRALVDGRRLHR
jgi:hypothetical protein